MTTQKQVTSRLSSIQSETDSTRQVVAPLFSSIEDALVWIHREHLICPFQYIYLCNQIPRSYELFEQLDIAPVSMVGNCNTAELLEEIEQMCSFFKGDRILVIDYLQMGECEQIPIDVMHPDWIVIS